ncbi:MAG: sporulation protein YqfD [Sedimentibacter sp.]|uniref:sporulation protein YqfD n=1 Tax=Sedimentibacter sp. TaxID=1960295 RepID=UPI002981A888|nr:sporulation protein YqfD [Sedimentibacter sp.]MDW5300349.1 sporulation protein YqfD [Sedimentibacter sp.]
MLIFKLMYLIKGYVIIRLENANCEKIMNLLRRKQITIWDVEKKENEIKFKISYDDYKKYSDIIADLKIEPVKKRGLAFKLNKIIIRKGFVGGLFILIICFYLLTSLIWNVEVIGVNHSTANKIINLLEKNEINLPISQGSLETKAIETMLYKNFDNFKFIEVYVEGSNLIIFVKEKVEETANIKSNDPTSIISKKNAIIKKVIAKSGQAVVKEGNVVYEGQTLVMGIVKNKNSEEFVMVPSEGIVYGKTYYNFEMKEEKLKNVNVATNKSRNVYYLKINGKNIKIIGDKEPYKNYNYKEYMINVPIFTDLTDINIVKGVYYEEVIKEIEIDENTAQNKLKVSMYDDLLNKCDGNSKILKSSMNFSQDEGYYYLKAQIEIIEDIGESVKIYPVHNNDEETNEEIEE